MNKVLVITGASKGIGRATAALFLENAVNPALLKQVAREAGVGIGGTLYADALTAPSGEAPTYVEMMRHNAAALREALLK